MCSLSLKYLLYCTHFSSSSLLDKEMINIPGGTAQDFNPVTHNGAQFK